MSHFPDALRPRVARLQRPALVVGAAGTAVSLVAGLFAGTTALPAYLVAVFYWTGIGLASVGLLQLQHLVYASWGYAIRRPLEAGAYTLGILAVLFIPIVLGAGAIYPWVDPKGEILEAVANKRGYLNLGAFTFRAVLYFGIGLVFAYFLNRWSDEQDKSDDVKWPTYLANLSGPGLLIMFLTATFCAIDWAMSREPGWYSTIYGAMVIIGWTLTTFALMVIITTLLEREAPGSTALNVERLNDLGNLLLAFTMLWAYMSFSQFLIIWAGNLSEEIPWYMRRIKGGWQYFAVALITLHFVAPFLLLLFRRLKRDAASLRLVAAWIAIMHLLDISWLIIPSSIADPSQPYVAWTTLALVPVAFLGVGGLWLAGFLWLLEKKSLIAASDPAFGAAAAHAGGH